MSHHLDTPLAAQTGQLYLDDLYVFPGQDSTVFIMDVNSNVNGLHSEPGFHHEARYEFKVHLDGAAYEDLTWRVSFGEADSDGQQAVALHTLTGEAARRRRRSRPAGAGRADRPDGHRNRCPAVGRADRRLLLHRPVAAGPHQRRGGQWDRAGPVRVAAGERAEQLRRQPGLLDRAGGLHAHPQLRPGARTGVWAATKLATDAGGWRQINRAGHPMMWPIFWPNDTDFTNPANTRHPAEDVDAAAKYIGEQIAAVVAAAGTSDDPSGYGQAVAADLFPDVLPYVVGTPAVYGFAGFNGRTRPKRPRSHALPGHQHRDPSGLKPASTKDQRARTFPYVVPA